MNSSKGFSKPLLLLLIGISLIVWQLMRRPDLQTRDVVVEQKEAVDQELVAQKPILQKPSSTPTPVPSPTVVSQDEKYRLLSECRELMPRELADHCYRIETELGFQCLKTLLEEGFGVSENEFEECPKFTSDLQIRCLKQLHPEEIADCSEIKTQEAFECLGLIGFDFKEDCRQISHPQAVSCLRVMKEKEWVEQYQICHSVTQEKEVSCLQQVENSEETTSCFSP